MVTEHGLKNVLNANVLALAEVLFYLTDSPRISRIAFKYCGSSVIPL